MQPNGDSSRNDGESCPDFRRSATTPSFGTRIHKHRGFEHSIESHRPELTAGPEDPGEGNLESAAAPRRPEELRPGCGRQGVDPGWGNRHRPLPDDSAGGNEDAPGLEVRPRLENACPCEKARLRTLEPQRGRLVGQQRE